MTVASDFLDAGGPKVDAVGTDDYGGVGAGAAGWIRGSESGGGGGGGDGVGEWLGVIGLAKMCLIGGLSV